MAKKDKGGIPTPNVIDPPETMEMTLCIPRNKDHMMAFFGALWELTMWDSWQPDEAHTGKELASVWYRYWTSWDRTMNELECEDGMAKCCTPNPELRRIDPETGRPQISYDNGVTWQASPDDVQSQITLLPPLVNVGGSKTKCDAATNASEHVNELITATGENLTAASNVFALAIGIAEAILALFLILISAGTLTAPVTAVATAIWAAATSLFAMGITAYNAYWTVDKTDAILCAIYCNIGENGQFTEEQYQAFRAKVKAVLPSSPALDIVLTSINAGGAVGMSQMASYGNAAEADCSSCLCGGCATFWVDKLDSGYTYGTIIEQTDEYVIVECHAPNVNGKYYGNIYTVDPDACCYLTDANIEVIEGTMTDGASWSDCGSFSLVGGLFGERCVNWLQPLSTVPFTIKYTFTDCPPDP